MENLAVYSHNKTLRPQASTQGYVKSLVAKVEAYTQYRRAFNEMNALSDRELADLGVARADIPAILKGTI